MNKVTRKVTEKTEILKIHGVRKNPRKMYSLGQPWAPQLTQHFFSQSVYFATAEDINLFIMVTVTPSKGRGEPPDSNITFVVCLKC